MQIVLVAIGSHGDVLPFIALGTALRERGCETLVLAPPAFEGLAERAALPFRPVAPSEVFDAINAKPELWSTGAGARIMFELAVGLARPVYETIAALAASGPVAVAASTLSFGARLAQEKLGLLSATVHLSPFLFRSRYAPPVLPGLSLPAWLPNALVDAFQSRADRRVTDPLVLPPLNAVRAELGLEPVTRLRHWWNAPDLVLLMVPDWFAPAQPDWPPRTVHTGFPQVDLLGDVPRLDGDMQAFLDAHPQKPLAFTYGSAMRHGRAFFESAVEICRRMGRRGILLAVQDGQVPEALPASVLRVAYAPFSLLLPACAGLVHHGGIGTTAQALAAGIPQLIVPAAFDQFDQGARIGRLRAGSAIAPADFTVEKAAEAIGWLLAAPEVARVCATARARLAGSDGIGAAADAVLAMIARRETA
jgi:rhamnosyltransferase subunit B